MNSQSRRRDRRTDKQAEWKAANPLLVGVSAKPDILYNRHEVDNWVERQRPAIPRQKSA